MAEYSGARRRHPCFLCSTYLRRRQFQHFHLRIHLLSLENACAKASPQLSAYASAYRLLRQV